MPGLSLGSPLRIGAVASRGGLTLKARIRSKASEIGERITAMQNLPAELTGLLDGWETCGGRTPAPPRSAPVTAGH